MHCATFQSPLGEILLGSAEGGLALLSFQDGPHRIEVPPSWILNAETFAEAKDQLDAYFAGSLESFDLRLAPRGTRFQCQVWAGLQRIPFGTTISYGELARRIHRPLAVRAVGKANGANPIPIVIPCHRVIGSDGSLTGYGGGLEVKEKLLAHEGARLSFWPALAEELL